MKKFILPVLLGIIVISCEKKKIETATNGINKHEDSVTVAETNEPIAVFNAVEYSPEQMTGFLSKKNQDTLYITNFFATWCGPCMKEIPHFKDKMQELKNKPVKFTFVSLYSINDWNTEVKKFAIDNQLEKNIIFVDGEKLSPDFFTKNFKTYDGSGIPFTFMRKGEQTDEYMSMMTKEQLDEKVSLFLK